MKVLVQETIIIFLDDGLINYRLKDFTQIHG